MHARGTDASAPHAPTNVCASKENVRSRSCMLCWLLLLRTTKTLLSAHSFHNSPKTLIESHISTE
jgi:hypothetical protein